eukprot:1261577-Pleurochrysis_carterae.AAC.1
MKINTEYTQKTHCNNYESTHQATVYQQAHRGTQGNGIFTQNLQKQQLGEQRLPMLIHLPSEEHNMGYIHQMKDG